MSILKRAFAALPGLAACLSMALAQIVAPSPAFSQHRPRADTPAPFVCEGNRFTNGDFSVMADPAVGPDAKPDQDIDAASGWGRLWDGNSLADLYSQGLAGTGSPPTPANGNYASMWIQNNNSPNVDAGFREGMFNRLVTPIQANTGIYSFTFKAAPLNAAQTVAGQPAAPSVVGIYGVYRPATATTLPQAPGYLIVPANEDLFGPGTGVRLGSLVTIPATADNHWVTYTITFDSAALGSLPEITHVMVTNSGGGASQARYIAFDDFCMQTAADAGLPTPSSGVSTCCPPSASFPLSSMFSSVQGNVAGNYHLNFTLSPALDAQMTAYVALVKAMDSSFLGLAMTIRVFDGGTGATPVVASGSLPLEPDAGIHWYAGGGGGNLWSSPFFTSASNRPVNRWTVVEMTVWSLGPGRPWSQECEVRRFAFRPQLVDPL